MAARKPLVIVSGLFSELPAGDTAFVLAAAPSGLIYVGSSLGIDGSAQISGNAGISAAVTAQASGNAALVVGVKALASGNLGVTNAATAQASGNAALVVGANALASGNLGVTNSATALASGNAALAVGSAKYDKTGGPINGDLTINAQGDLRLADSDSSNYVALQAPSTVASNVTFTLPSADGTNGQVLGTNGSGVLSFSTPSGGTILYNRRPALQRGSLFYKTAATTLSVVAGAVLNGQYYASATAVTMPSHTNNTDYAIWQHPTTGALVGDASFVTAPAGAPSGSIVGGYHYIPSGRPTAFNNGSPTAAAEILEYSIWDLTWRPECPDPRGMANIDGRLWADLYLAGATSYAGTTFSAVPSSKIGLTIADNSSPALIPSFYGGNGSTAYSLLSGNNPGSWYNAAEVAHSFGKRLPWSWEFQALAYGAPEASSRGSDPGVTTWEYISKWGCAQSTGVMLQWGAERVGIYTSGTNTNTGGRGTEYADAPRAVFLGGSWGGGAESGSRCANWYVGPSYGYDSVGSRFVAGHLCLA